MYVCKLFLPTYAPRLKLRKSMKSFNHKAMKVENTAALPGLATLWKGILWNTIYVFSFWLKHGFNFVTIWCFLYFSMQCQFLLRLLLWCIIHFVLSTKCNWVSKRFSKWREYKFYWNFSLVKTSLGSPLDLEKWTFSFSHVLFKPPPLIHY